jgi:hypothetical protein
MCSLAYHNLYICVFVFLGMLQFQDILIEFDPMWIRSKWGVRQLHRILNGQQDGNFCRQKQDKSGWHARHVGPWPPPFNWQAGGLWLNLTCLHGNIWWYCHRQVHASALVADLPHTRVADSVSRIMVRGRGCPVMGSRQMRAQKGTILVVRST